MFVQVIKGRTRDAEGIRRGNEAWRKEGARARPWLRRGMGGGVTDRAKLESMESEELLGKLRAARPDLIGSLRVWFPEGAFVDTAYFTNEADARKGESSGEFSGPQQELGCLLPA